AFAAGYQPLDDAGLDGPAGREALVVSQPLCRQGEGLCADNRRDRYFDPFVTGPFVTAALVPMDRPPRQAKRLCRLLPRADLGLAEVTVAIGGGTQNRDLPGLGAMALAAAGPFENLRPFVFGDHALELQHQLIFGRVGMRRLQEDRLDSVTSELFGQQYLIGIFSTQAIG